MKLTWFALSDRDDIFTYIEAGNPSAAVLIDERIRAATCRLIDSPANGRIGRIAGTRKLVINGTPYVAAYAVTETKVRILHVLHGGGIAKLFASHLNRLALAGRADESFQEYLHSGIVPILDSKRRRYRGCRSADRLQRCSPPSLPLEH